MPHPKNLMLFCPYCFDPSDKNILNYSCYPSPDEGDIQEGTGNGGLPRHDNTNITIEKFCNHFVTYQIFLSEQERKNTLDFLETSKGNNGSNKFHMYCKETFDRLPGQLSFEKRFFLTYWKHG